MRKIPKSLSYSPT